jgi:hypothetical protein
MAEYNLFGLLLKIPPKGGTTNALLKTSNKLVYRALLVVAFNNQRPFARKNVDNGEFSKLSHLSKAKLELIRMPRERKEMRRHVIDLMRFIDWELALPQNMELELTETLEKEDKEMGKPYISSWERMAMREGHATGAPETLHANIALRQAVKCESPDAFVEHLPVAV